MTLQSFLQAGWRDHGDHPEDVAIRLAESLALVEAPADVAPFVRLLTHVHGEHLGQWQRGIDLLEALARVPAFDGSALVRGPVMRGTAMLRFVGGDPSALEGLSDEDATHALASAADALAARGQVASAIAAFSLALARVPDTLDKEHPAARALAVCGNNFSAVLEKSADLGPAETRAMIAAAETGLRYWKLAGTWLEEERADYQLSRCQLRAGDVEAAMASIDRCIAVCTRNDAPPFELFFGHAVRAVLHRVRGEHAAFVESRRAALEHYVLIPADEQRWCEREHTELGG
ncbi:MAG: hypothetical protein JWQ76_4352 [Ramlibacter sp.]|nr:hypothetical protein [Ramlibacter sp.]